MKNRSIFEEVGCKKRVNSIKQVAPGNLLLFFTIIAALFPLTGFGQNNPVMADGSKELGTFYAAPCPFELPANLSVSENFEFGYVHVPEYHSDPDGRTLKLAVAIFRSTGENPRKDAIVMNTSGPGKSNLDNFIPPISADLGNYILPNRDVVIIELRGLRYSEPFLEVIELREARRQIMEMNLTFSEEKRVLLDAIKKAKKRFDAQGVDLSAFNNRETADDIAMIMTNLGYDKFNLVGSSAGTMVAQHVMNRYPERIRSVVLDAGLPLDELVMREYVPSIVDMLKRYFQECRTDPSCENAYPNLEERFLKLLDELNEAPINITVADPSGDRQIEYLVNGTRLANYVFLNMFYSTQIPMLINTILDKKYDDLRNFIEFSLVPNHFADGLGFTVFISESGYYSGDDIRFDPDYATFAEGVELSCLGADFLLEVQKLWNIDKFEDKYKNDQVDKAKNEGSKIPVLVLNGKYDPVIPEKFDSVLKEDWSAAQIFRFDGVPHSAFDNATPCVLPMILQFLEDPTSELSTDCVQNYRQEFQVQ